jgi:hypothetical protein
MRSILEKNCDEFVKYLIRQQTSNHGFQLAVLVVTASAEHPPRQPGDRS